MGGKGWDRCLKVRMRKGRLIGAGCHVKQQQEVNYCKWKENISFCIKMYIQRFRQTDFV